MRVSAAALFMVAVAVAVAPEPLGAPVGATTAPAE